jgi:hypothetical protein
MKLHAMLTSAVVAAVMASCAVDETTTDQVDVADDAGKADSATETKVRTGETSVWIRTEIARQTRGDRQVLVVRGRASRDVIDGYGFVFDDPVGDWASLTARTFEVTYATDDAGLLDGGQHFVRLGFKPSASRPDWLTALVVARTRLVGFSGNGASLGSDVAPVINAGRTVWRVTGTTPSKMYGLRVNVGEATKLDDRHFRIDLAREDVFALVGTSSWIEIGVDLADGAHTKKARLGARVKTVGLTSEDPYEVWPPASCTDEVRSCLDALPDGTLDLASCGEAIEVRMCQGQIGVTFDDVAFQAATQLVNARSSSAAFRSDAVALVGADKSEELQFLVEQTAQSRFENLFGTWYVDAAARDAAVAAAIEGVFDLAYARPLTLGGEPHAPAPGNLAGTRQVIADALLTYLDGVDLTNTEFGRPLEVLAHEYRARHVADLRAWRETATAQDAGNGRDVYVGNWLDPYVEITVVRATGVVENVFFEID